MYHHIKNKLGGGMKTWLRDEEGAVTVDWVVLLGGIVTMVLVVMLSISGGVKTFGDKTETQLSAREVSVY